MLVDVQGARYTLRDPEIALKQEVTSGHILSGLGNLFLCAISHFSQRHTSPNFCYLAELDPLCHIANDDSQSQ